MRASDLTVEVRDRTLTRVGVILPVDIDLDVDIDAGQPGAWKLTLPGSHLHAADLRTPGAGIVVTGPGGRGLFSGSVTAPGISDGVSDPIGRLEATGASDNDILFGANAWPDPSNADPGTQAAAYDVRTGPAESVMKAIVAANVGPAAPAARRPGLLSRLVVAPDLGRGPTVVKSLRMASIPDVLNDIAAGTGMRWEIVQQGDQLVFDAVPIEDRSTLIRLDIGTGALASRSVKIAAPTATRVLVMGQGEGADRQILLVTTPESLAAEAEWGIVRERVLDQRQTNDVDELYQAGLEVLTAEGLTSTNVAAVPGDVIGREFAVDWNVGDRVGIVFDAGEESSPVTGAKILLNRDGLRIGAKIGDVSSFNQRAATNARIDTADARIQQLERNSEFPTRLSESGQALTDWHDITAAGFYYNLPGALNQPAGIDDHWTGYATIDDRGRILVQASRPWAGANPASHETWRMVGAGGSWGDWTSSFSSIETTDWNAAVRPGFWWSSGTAANGPLAAELLGFVEVTETGAVIQTVHQSGSSSLATIARTWRRRGSVNTGVFGAWVDISPPEAIDWTDIRSQITVASGWTIPEFWVKRVGPLVAYNCNSASVIAGAFDVGPSGNIVNQTVISGIPEQFRAASARSMPLPTLGAGPLAAFYANSSGTVILSAMLPGNGPVAATTFAFGGPLLT